MRTIEKIYESMMFEPTFTINAKSKDRDLAKARELIKKNPEARSLKQKYVDKMFDDLKNGVNFSEIQFNDNGYFYTRGEYVLDPGDVERFYRSIK